MSMTSFVADTIDIGVLVPPSGLYHIDEEDIIEHSFVYNRDILPNQMFELGTTASATIEFDIKGGLDEYGLNRAEYFYSKFFGKKGVRLTPSTTTTLIAIGTFYINELSMTDNGNLHIFATDRMIDISNYTGYDVARTSGISMSNYIRQRTLGEIVQDICDTAGIILATDLTGFTNSDWYNFEPGGTSAMFQANARTILSLVCALMCAYAHIENGEMVISHFNTDYMNSTEGLDFNRTFVSNFGDDLVPFGGVRVLFGSSEYSYIADSTKPIYEFQLPYLIAYVKSDYNTRLQNIYNELNNLFILTEPILRGFEAKVMTDWSITTDTIFDEIISGIWQHKYYLITKIQKKSNGTAIIGCTLNGVKAWQ